MPANSPIRNHIVRHKSSSSKFSKTIKRRNIPQISYVQLQKIKDDYHSQGNKRLLIFRGVENKTSVKMDVFFIYPSKTTNDTHEIFLMVVLTAISFSLLSGRIWKYCCTCDNAYFLAWENALHHIKTLCVSDCSCCNKIEK